MKAKLFLIVLVLFCVAPVFADFPEQPFTEFVLGHRDGTTEKIKLEDGVDLSKFESISAYWSSPPRYPIQIGRLLGTLKNVNFSGLYMNGADLRETSFENCNFTGTILMGADFSDSTVEGCDFTDADIQGASIGGMTTEQFKSTHTYKNGGLLLRGGSFGFSDCPNVDFSNMDLTNSGFGPRLTNCNFTDARIKGVSFGDGAFHFRHDPSQAFSVKIEQLLVTKDFKEGFVERVCAYSIIFPEDQFVNFSKMVFIDCEFDTKNHAKVDLTDSVISGCDFSAFGGLTLENVKSTWNYKHNRMEGIKLPESIQKALDAEKEKQ